MNPLDQFKNINASQKAIGAAMGGIAKLDWVNAMTQRIQYPTNIAAFGGALDIIRSMQQNTGYESMNSVASVASGIAPLLAWYKDNPLKNQMDGIITNHALLSQRLSSISPMYPANYVKPFNAMEVAIRGISTAFLKNIPFDDIDVAEYEYEVVEELTEVIAIQAETLQASSNDYVTQESFEKFKTQIFDELEQISSKTKSEKIKLFILQLMQVISFAVMIYTLHTNSQKMTNGELSEIIDNKFKSHQEQTNIKLDSILNQLTKQRIATTNVHLRVNNKKRSAIKGIVKKGQLISVIETRHKYLLIYYIDKETNEPKSGFVYKKYFEKID